MDEFYVSAFSNSDTILYPNNTLTRFENNLPVTYNLRKEDNWHVCLQNVGFSTDFKNIILPNNKNLPSIYISSQPYFQIDIQSLDTNNLITSSLLSFSKVFNQDNTNKISYPINNLKNEATIFFPDTYISPEIIDNIFKKVLDENKTLKLEFLVHDGKPFSILPTFLNTEVHLKYWIVIHENLVETFDISLTYGKEDKIAKNISFEGEKYYVFEVEKESDVINSFNLKWQNKYPEYVRIKCDEINEQIFNGELSKDLSILKPNFNNEKNYLIYEFENENYLPLSNTTVNKISISITDKYNCFLNLNRGTASFIKLKFKKMYTNNFFHVCAESKENQCNQFHFNLPQGLYLDSDWRVALSSINFVNNLKPLPYEEKLRTIMCGNFSSDGKISNLYKYVLPNIKYTSVRQIVALINIFVKDNLDSNIYSEVEADKIKINFHIKHGTILTFSTEIAEILGFQFEKNNKNVVITSENITIATLPNAESQNQYINIKFQGFANLNILNPQYLMIYTDLIEPTIVGSTFANLLKIVPLSTKEGFQNEEIKNKEFHPLSSTHIKKVNVNIRSHSGNLINFVEKTKVFLNLLFVRK